MKLIHARYLGQNGSLGYKTGEVYQLIIRELGWLESKFAGHKIEIWRSTRSNVSSHGSVTGYCPYSSMTSFLLNWEVLAFYNTNVSVQITPPEIVVINQKDRYVN